jgi:hypothetical protein
MKLIAILLFLMPLAMLGQTADSYKQTMEKFKKFYNAGQGDSINAMFGHEWDKMKLTKALWTNEKADELLKEYGKLESFEFVGVDKEDPNKVYVFLTVFSKKNDNVTSLTIDSENKLSTFRFSTSSNEIDRLLKSFKIAGK